MGGGNTRTDGLRKKVLAVMSEVMVDAARLRSWVCWIMAGSCSSTCIASQFWRSPWPTSNESFECPAYMHKHAHTYHDTHMPLVNQTWAYQRWCSLRVQHFYNVDMLWDSSSEKKISKENSQEKGEQQRWKKSD